MILVLLGPPGAGKGTQGVRLCADLNLRHLSSGDVLRSEMKRGTPLGRQVAEFINHGQLVPDAIVTEVVLAQLRGTTGHDGCLLDGFPRTVGQATSLDDEAAEWGRKVDLVLSLRVPDAVIVERITGRRICPTCGRVYHLTHRPPRELDHCDEDGSELIHRDDDTAAVVEKRLAGYHALTEPLELYYRQRGKLAEVDGTMDPDAVYRWLIEVIHRRLEQGS